LSGTYYVSIPPDAHSGAFEFIDPRVNGAALSIEGAACFDPAVILKPKTGMMMIFPSYLRHWVHPNEEETERVSIAFNIRWTQVSAVAAPPIALAPANGVCRLVAEMVGPTL
jgi:uncharacterized protein (TIGR02466 family)